MSARSILPALALAGSLLAPDAAWAQRPRRLLVLDLAPNAAPDLALRSALSSALAARRIEPVFPAELDDPWWLPAANNAEDRLSAARDGLARAAAAFAELRVAEATQILDPIVASLWETARVPADVGLLRDAMILHAQALLEAGRRDEAIAVFDQVAAMSPALELDPARYSPFVREAFAVARGRDRGTGGLSVRAYPAATLGLDTAVVGSTPRSVAGLAAGSHVLTLSMPAPSGESHARRISIERDRTLELVAIDPRVLDSHATLEPLLRDQAEAVRATQALVVRERSPGGIDLDAFRLRDGIWTRARTTASDAASLATALATLWPPPAARPRPAGPSRPWYAQWWLYAGVSAIVTVGIVVVVLLMTNGPPVPEWPAPA